MEANKPRVDNLMISANCNTVPKSLCYNPSLRLLAYASANTVLILDPYHSVKDSTTVPKVLYSLRGHEARVNGV